jgi:hypothetical protein
MLRHLNLMRQAFGPGWALVGDAGYHRDAVTAHGISDAFRDAELLNRTTIADYFGVGEERTHERTFVFDADHPAVLVGQDHGPIPAESVLHALAACSRRHLGTVTFIA